MLYTSAALLITALAIISTDRSVDAWIQNVTADQATVEAPLAVEEAPSTEQPPQPSPPPAPPQPTLPAIANQTNSPELRPPSKPPITPDKFYFDRPKLQQYYKPTQGVRAPPLHRLYTREQLKQLSAVYRRPSARPMQRRNLYYSKPPPRQPLLFAASTGKPTVAHNPKFSIPVQTINGIRADFVRPPPFVSTTTTTTTTTTPTPTTTTRKILRTKRIWPKRILEKMNITTQNPLQKNNDNNTNDARLTSPSNRLRTSNADNSVSTTTSRTTTRGYRRVTRTSKVKYTTPASFIQDIEPNDWVPIMPSHFANRKKSQTIIRKRSDRYKTLQTPISRRSDRYLDSEDSDTDARNLLYLQSYGALPVSAEQSVRPTVPGRKPVVFFRKKKRHPQSYAVSSTIQEPQYAISAEGPRILYNSPPSLAPASYLSPPLSPLSDDNFSPHSPQPEIITPSPSVTKVKHHHHHHHHRYVKTVEKPVEVPVKVEVPKPYPVEKKVPVPVPVEKVKVVDRPVPVQVEKKVPYPVTVRVPQPVPVKVVEKEYVPKPFPVVHHVPIVKHVQVPVPHPVPVPVEKRIPYPVQVPVPVEKKVPYPITVEKQVPYPYPVKIYVPKPYPVEKRVPYPVEVKVKEPFEVIRHVKVPVLRPYAVRVPHPIPVPYEKRVPYPVKVIKRVPYRVEVLVPQRIPVEKKVPIYIPKPYPVEKKVPYPIKVPYPVKVPVRVPVYVSNPFQILSQQEGAAGSASQYYDSYRPSHESQYESSPSSQYEEPHGASDSPYYADGASESSYYADEDADRIGRSASAVTVTPTPPIRTAVTVHGNTGYNGVISRSDSEGTTTSAAPT